VKGLIAGMDSQYELEIFNLGTGKNYNLNELVAILNDILGTNIKPEYIPNPLKNYVQDTLCCTEKVKKALGWEASFDLEKGIRKIISYQQR